MGVHGRACVGRHGCAWVSGHGCAWVGTYLKNRIHTDFIIAQTSNDELMNIILLLDEKNLLVLLIYL